MGRKKKKPIVIPEVEITGIADKGRGVGRSEEGKVVFVDNVAPGDIVDVLVFKKKSGHMFGVPQTFHKYSEERVIPFCEHFGVCGGCKWQHITYEAQTRNKQIVVENALQRIGKVPVGEMLPIIPAVKTTFYRNKLEFTFSNKRWLTRKEMEAGVSNYQDVLGFHRSGAFDKIVDIKHCFLQEDPSNAIRNRVRDIALEQELTFYDLKENKGFLRHIMIRVTTIGQVLLIVSFHEDDQSRIQPFLDEILTSFPQITTLCYCINPKLNDYVLDLDMITYHGKGFIEEQLKHVRFKIGPKSFFQTNTRQAEILYDIVVDFADLKGTENVYDLYTGIGSIALYIAKDCEQVVGIEEVEEAIRDAEENAARNDIQNTVFYAGDVKDILTDEFAAQHGKPDLLITDPPRAGMHPKVVKMLLQLEAPRMVYVSCNPATQARDLNILHQKYDILKVQPVDMFPHTHHIESVALLELRPESEWYSPTETEKS